MPILMYAQMYSLIVNIVGKHGDRQIVLTTVYTDSNGNCITIFDKINKGPNGHVLHDFYRCKNTRRTQLCVHGIGTRA